MMVSLRGTMTCIDLKMRGLIMSGFREFRRDRSIHSGQVGILAADGVRALAAVRGVRPADGGDRKIKTFPCGEHLRVMAFAQLTYRESLRNIETCLRAVKARWYHLGTIL